MNLIFSSFLFLKFKILNQKMEKSFVERMWGISIFFRSRRKYSFAIDSPIYIRRIPQKKEKKKNVKTWQRKKRIRPPWKLFFSPPDTSRPWQAFVHLGRVNGTLCVRVSRPRFCHFVAAVKLDAIRDEKKKREEEKEKEGKRIVSTVSRTERGSL